MAMCRALIILMAFGTAGCGQAQERVQSPVSPGTPSTQNADCAFAGHWQNERGSGVHFICEAKGRLSGVYSTNVGAPDQGERFALTGWAEGDNAAFSVNFKGYGSITAWTGQIEDTAEGPQLRTLWHLTRDVSDEKEPQDLWKSITAGASVFRRADAD